MFLISIIRLKSNIKDKNSRKADKNLNACMSINFLTGTYSHHGQMVLYPSVHLIMVSHDIFWSLPGHFQDTVEILTKVVYLE